MTPGRTAYEAWQATRWPHEEDRVPWDHPAHSDRSRAAWEAAAEAAAAPVYRERARLVAFLAACYGCTVAYGEDGDEWPVVFIETPAGQMSWHISERDADLFCRLAPCVTVAVAHWDGHTTEAKYERLAEMAGRIHQTGGLAGVIASMAKPEHTQPYPTAVERDELRAERDEARAVVREMCAVLAEYGEGGQDNDQIVQWNERAGTKPGEAAAMYRAEILREVADSQRTEETP
jgi:hypothetical protein